MLRSLRGNATQPETNPLREAAFFRNPFLQERGAGRVAATCFVSG
jgi:hypothetical protein